MGYTAVIRDPKCRLAGSIKILKNEHALKKYLFTYFRERAPCMCEQGEGEREKERSRLPVNVEPTSQGSTSQHGDKDLG